MSDTALDEWVLPGQLIEVGQLRCLDAIRACLMGVRTNYSRLVSELNSPKMNGFRAINDAWAIVDSAHRLRIMVNHTPGLRQKDPTVGLLVRSLAQAEPFRNALQHAEERLPQRVEEGASLLGDLYYHYRRDDGSVGISYIFIGTMHPDSYSVNVPAPSESTPIEETPSFVHLVYGQEVLNLSDLAARCEQFFAQLRAEILSRVSGMESGSATPSRLPLFSKNTAPRGPRVR